MLDPERDLAGATPEKLARALLRKPRPGVVRESAADYNEDDTRLGRRPQAELGSIPLPPNEDD
jgi:hypothetical protein